MIMVTFWSWMVEPNLSMCTLRPLTCCFLVLILRSVGFVLNELGSRKTWGCTQHRLSGDSKNVNHVIWKPWFACVRVTCCFGISLLHASAVGIAITEPLWSNVCKSLHDSQWLVRRLRVADPWFVVHFVLLVTALQGLFVSFENVYFPAEELFRVVLRVSTRALPRLFCPSFATNLTFFDGVHHGCAPCPLTMLRISVAIFEDQVALGLCPWQMDKYLWEHIQIFLSRDDLLCPRVSKCALLLVSLELVFVMLCKRHLFLWELFNFFHGEAGEWVSHCFKVQVYGTFRRFSLFGRCVCCLRLGSSGIPRDCLSRFAM